MVPAPLSVLSGKAPDLSHEAIAGVFKASNQQAMVLPVSVHDPRAQMVSDVSLGMADPNQKSIPSAYLYDQKGSELFETITTLPEYYPTRLETALLREIVPSLRQRLGPLEIVELGSGSSTKTHLFLDAWQAATEEVTYIPIDVNQAMLETTAQHLIERYPKLYVLGLAGRFEEALAVLPQDRRRLLLFLGGTIGNFTTAIQASFFYRLACLVTPGTYLLLGFDYQPHAGKSVKKIEQAYNDTAGVTASFNRNILSHVNARLGTDFDLEAWDHEALYNQGAHQIEMSLVSQRAQQVQIPGSGVSCFEPGDRILTEISRRFEPQTLAAWFEHIGYRCVEQWSDPNQYFGLMLLEINPLG